MTSKPGSENIEIAQRYLAAAYSGDLEAAASLLDEDVVLDMAGANELSGTYRGRDAFFGVFAKMLELSGNTYTMTEQHDWLASERGAVLVASEQVGTGDTLISFDRAVHYEIAGGRIRRVRIFEGDPVAVDKAFSAAS